METIAVASIILQQLSMISSSPISTSATEIAVKWKVITSPVVFGESVTLECKVTRNVKHKWSGLDKYHFEWTGGKGNKILCRDGSKCIDVNKYNMMTDHREKKSKLEILEFMESDLDYEYTCSFEYKTFSKRLTLKLLEFNIIKSPINDASLESVFIKDGFLLVAMTLENVYPKPICFVDFMYWPKNAFSQQLLNVSTSQNESFLNAYLEGQFKVPGDICKGKSVISCDFGPKKYPVSIVEIDNCTSQANNDIMTDVKSTTSIYVYALAIGLPVFLTLVNVIGLYAFVRYKNKRQKPANIDEIVTRTLTTTTETFRRPGKQRNQGQRRNMRTLRKIRH